MAQPNGHNPDFTGRVGAAGFDGLHGNGVSITPVNTNTTTEVDVFDTTNNFDGTITGVYLISTAATSATLTLKNGYGTVGTITTSATAGTLTGMSSLSNTTISKWDSLQVVLSGANGYAASATVFVTYSVAATS